MRATEAQQWEANVRASARSRTNVFLLSPSGAELSRAEQGRAGHGSSKIPNVRSRRLYLSDEDGCSLPAVISRAFMVPLSRFDRSDPSEQPHGEVNRAMSYSYRSYSSVTGMRLRVQVSFADT